MAWFVPGKYRATLHNNYFAYYVKIATLGLVKLYNSYTMH